MAVVASAIASTATSISPLTSLVGDHESFGGLVSVLALATLFFAARLLATGAGASLILMAATTVPATATAVYALVQAGGGDPIVWGGTASFGGVTRAFATLGHPNLLGAYVSMTIPLTASLAVTALRRGRKVPASVLLAAVLLQMTTAIITSSRAAWLAVAFSAVLLAAGWFAAGARRAALAALMAPALAALALAGAAYLASEPGVLSSLADRVRRFAESPSRREIWSTAVMIHSDHFWLGSGLDTFRLAFSPRRSTAYAELEWNTTPVHAHNGALQVLSTQGLVGAAALGFLLAALVLRTVSLRRHESAEIRERALALGAGLAAFAVAGAFGGTSLATASLAAVLAGTLSGMGPVKATTDLRPTRDVALGGSLGLVLAFLLFAVNLPSIGQGAALALVALVPAVAVGFAANGAVRTELETPHPNASGPLAPTLPPPSRALAWRLGAWTITAAALVLLVLSPIRADQEAQRGRVLAARDREAAIAAHRRSVDLVPWREVLWLRLGATSHAAGIAATSVESARGHLGLARQAFEQAVALAPPDPYAHMQLAGTLAELVRRRELPGGAAIAQADRAISLDPNNALFYVAATNIALAAGDTVKARTYAQACLERYPRLGAPRYLLGRIALMTGDADEAIREMEAALDGDWHGDSATREFVTLELDRLRTRQQP